MTKKGKIITILAGLLFVYITDSAEAVINDVQITPDEPVTEDIITIVTFGTETRGAVTVIDSVVNITDTNIGLDLTLKVGFAYIITPWSYSEDIGILPAGTYDLTVRIIVDSDVKDSYFTTFQVVPEPAMALDGSGTKEDPWLIKSLENFNVFAADANYWAGFTRLETDIDLTDRVYERAVIAWDTDSSNVDFDGTSFTGVFDGNDYKIMNLVVNDVRKVNDFVGLFGRINGGQVRNLGIEGGFVRGDRRVGGLMGSGSGITNCYSTCNANGNIAVGSLVGVNEFGSISNCHSTGDVTGSGGGLVGYNYFGSISNCYAIGYVSGGLGGGGLVGYNYHGSISNCYAIGSVSGIGYAGGLVWGNEAGSISDCNSSCYVTGDVGGGLVGVNGFVGWYGIIRNCHSTGHVNAVRAGGLVGENLYGSFVSNSYSSGFVNGELVAGGLMGFNDHYSSVLNCYSTGDVNGVEYVGGLVGYLFDGSITNCYSIGSVKGQYFVGGLIGMNNDIVSNCFWDTDTQTHGVADSFGENKGTVTKVEGLPTAEMKIKSTFTSAGWDFVGETDNGSKNIWTIHDTVDYPKFVWELVSFIGWYEVDFLDFAFFANHWMDDNCGVTSDCNGADLDFSDKVDEADMKIFLDHWLKATAK